MFTDIILNLGDEFNLNANNPAMLISRSDIRDKNIASCIQTHSNHVQYINTAGIYENTDGLVTHIDNNIYLVIQTADCVPIFMLDDINGIIGLIHSGWKGTCKSIIVSALSIFSDYGSSMNNIKIFLGPSIKSCCYEIKDDVAKYFNQKFIIKDKDKLFLDLDMKIKDDLYISGVKKNNIFVSNICTYENNKFCSYRRDNNKSGRMYSIIG